MSFPLKKTLRVLLVLELHFGVAAGIIDIFLEKSFAPELQAYNARLVEETGLWELIMIFPIILILLGLLVSMIMVWRLHKAGRFLYTVFWLLAEIGLLTMQSVYITSSPGMVLDELSVTFGGIILGLLYFSDLKKHFI